MKIAEKKDKAICPAYHCKKKKADKKRFCHRHHAVQQKANNEGGYVFNLLKQNAKRRGKDFTLTLDEFRRFCAETRYLENRGRNKRGFSIDRIDNALGYSLDNIQILTTSQNSKKGVATEVPF